MPVFSLPNLGIWWFVIIFGIIVISVIFEVLRNKDSDIDNISEIIKDKSVLKINVPKDIKNSFVSFEQLLLTFHSFLGNNSISYELLSLEIYADMNGIVFIIVVPRTLKNSFIQQMYAFYPESEIEEVEDYVNEIYNYSKSQVIEFAFDRESMFPIKTFSEFGLDPLNSVLSNLTELKGIFGMQLVLRSVNEDWQKAGKNYLNKIKKGRSGKLRIFRSIFGVLTLIYNGVFSVKDLKAKRTNLAINRDYEITAIEKKIGKPGFQFKLRVFYSTNDSNSLTEVMNNMVSTFEQFNNYNLNGLKLLKKNEDIDSYRNRYLRIETVDIINTVEASTIFHIPDIEVGNNKINWLRNRKIALPIEIPNSICTYIGVGVRNHEKIKFGIRDEDRRRHMYILGKTGTGKTSLMKNLIIQDILSGKGVGVIDPHGDLVNDILTFIPKDRINDVVFVNAADIENPVSINIFDTGNYNKDYLADSILSIFKKHFDSWGPRLEYILHNTILSLLFSDDVNMLGITRMLTDIQYRRVVLRNVKDPILLRFWYEEYSYMERNSRLLSEVISPIQNKVGRFLSSPLIRNIVGQKNSTIDFENIMNTNKIFLCDLSQGKIGEENANLLGSLIITKMQLAALSRAAILESQRSDFYLYIDEFQVFATESFAKILSEARKYRLNLILANQFLGQLEENTRNSVLGNIGTLLTFSIGSQDISIMEKEFGLQFKYEDFTNLGTFEFYIKEVVNNIISKPFSGESYNISYERHNLSSLIIKSSQDKYSVNKKKIEEEIKDWNMSSFQSSKPISQIPLSLN